MKKLLPPFFNPLHPNIGMHILLTIPYTIPKGADEENLFNNQELLKLAIISFILMTLMCDLGGDIVRRIRF